METRANHILIGSFVIAVVLLTLGCLLWLGKFGGERDSALYDIVFSESVIGLSKGSVVSYNGVPVGEVASLTIDPKDLARVVVRVRINGRDLVRRDTEATLGFAAVTGVADIRLAGGSLQSPRLHEEGKVPSIVASPSPLARLTASGQDIMVNINEVAARLADLLSPENVAKVESVLGNVDSLAASIGSERETLAEAIRQLSVASGQLQATLVSIDGAADSVRGLMDGEVRGLLTSANVAVEKLDALTVQLDGLVSENRAAVSGFSQQGLRQIGPAMEELRTTLAAVQQLSDRLSRSDSVLLGNPQPREFKPR
ncbi:MlaD family protein [Xanthomonadaceae bacterium JHOS43]|nr:MlaD family protein [Xanthomonadaceae bacterium JHOS43]MCX7562746.1 MlaD family protein [Xanthomonadaceae bacterium XH05]